MYNDMIVLLGGLGFTDIKIDTYKSNIYIKAKGNVFDLLSTNTSIIKDLMAHYNITDKQAKQLLAIAGEYTGGDYRNISELQYIDNYKDKLKLLGIDADSFVYTDNLIINTLDGVLNNAADILNTFN